ncbi:MAG: hypothetical protein K6F15_02835 [Treponema sp.]|nr:hypothetical protein [Treponema sp.]
MTKTIRFLILLIFSFFSCSAKEDYNFHCTKWIYYEVGFDSRNNVYLTDTRSKEQIVFICDDVPYSDYSKEDLLKHYKNDKHDSYSEFGDYSVKSRMEVCKKKSTNSEVIYSKHFKSNITRYYVTYEKVYFLFHM